MNVRKLLLQNVTTHDHTELTLPERGIVALTGENGAGKSTLVEAVAWTAWGKTLRGTPLWRGDAKGDDAMHIEIDTDDLHMERSRKGGKSEFSFKRSEYPKEDYVEGGDDGTFETPTKAAHTLARMLGPFDLWRRSHVFSSADATHFTIATDKERKQLIESFLGNTVFEPAIEACRADLKKANDRVLALRHENDAMAARLELERKRIAETKRALAAAVAPTEAAPGKPGRSMAELDKLMGDTRKAINDATAKLRAADRAGAGFDQMAKAAHDLLDRLRGDRCPTCKQVITKDLRASIQLDANTAKGRADIERQKANVGREEIEALIAELDEELDTVQQARQRRANELATEAAARAEVDRYTKLRAGLERTLRDAEAVVAELEPKLEEVAAQWPVAVADADELAECEKVLGLKGVRAMVLGQALSGIEALTNAWLARLNQGIQVELRAYSETAKGGVNDSISLEVAGAGGGYGYKGSSSGERRRLDVALLLSLAEVASAARGQTNGTLWFDEVFDHLDDNGKDFVAAALAELAETRTVVVITHSKTFLERLPIAQLVHVAQGRLDVVQRQR